MAVTQSCFEWQNTHQLPDMRTRDLCLGIWFVSSFAIMVLQLACIALMAYPPRFVQGDLTSSTRVAVGSFAVIVLLTNPWTSIVLTVMLGGTLS